MGTKIRCPNGDIKTAEECLECGKCYPPPVMRKLLAGPLKRRSKKKRDKPRFGVTRVTAECLRKSYFDMVEEVIHSLDKFWIFSRGHAIHDFIQADMPKEDVEVFKQVNFALFDLIGFIDAVHEGVLYEFKTTANLPEMPQEHHILQSQAYFSMLSPEEQAKIDKISIIYFSLSNIKHFEIPKRIITPFLEANGTILAQALKTGEPPMKTKSWLCKFCEFKEQCEAADRGEYVVPNSEEKKEEPQNKKEEEANTPSVTYQISEQKTLATIF